MKNLSLKDLKLTPEKLLETDQLKTVFGGGYDGDHPCRVLCHDDTRVDIPNCAPATANAAGGSHGGKNHAQGLLPNVAVKRSGDWQGGTLNF